MNKNIYIPSILSLIMLLLSFQMKAQIGINNTQSAPDSSAILDVESTQKGMLMPRMTSAQRDVIPNPVPGLTIYNLEDGCFNYYTGSEWVKDCGREIDGPLIPPVSINGTGNNYSNSIGADKDGNSYIAGQFLGTIHLGDTSLIGSQSYSIFVAKIAPSGKTLWAKMIGEGKGVDISVDELGNSYFTGDFEGTATFGDTTLISNNGSMDIFITKIDPSGQFLWASKISVNSGSNFGGGGAKSIAIDDNGNTYLTGGYTGTATFGGITLTSSGTNSIFITKLDPNGQFLWAVKGVATSGVSAEGITVDPSGNNYITGSFKGNISFGPYVLNSAGDFDIYMAKIDPNGQFIWASKAGGSNMDRSRDIGIDGTGNIYITGNFNKIAAFGGDTLTTLIPEVFVSKVDPTGQFLWTIKAGGSYSEGFSIDVDEIGNSYITGIIGDGLAVFGGDSLISEQEDVFVTKVDPSGTFLWTSKGGGDLADYGEGIAINSSGGVFVTGTYRNVAIFGDSVFTSLGANDIFIWTLNLKDGLNGLIENNLSDLETQDTDPTNELQNLSFSGQILSIENGNSVDLSPIDDQTLSVLGSLIKVSNDNFLNLSSIDTDTDEQTLSLSGYNLSISNGNTVDLSNVDSDKQNLHISGNILTITGGNSIDLSSIDTDTDNQTISLSGNTLSISAGNNVDLSGVGPDNQTLSLSFGDLSISGGNSVDLSGVDTDTDDQTLILVGSDLTITDGNTIDISSVNTDSQSLSLSGTMLSISNGNNIDLNALSDNMGDHIAHQNLSLGNNYLSRDGDDEGIYILSDGKVGIGTNNPNQPLHLKTEGNSILEYALEVHNPHNSFDGATGILFSADNASDQGKGALVYYGQKPYAAGDFMFLQADNSSFGNPTLSDAVMIIEHWGKVGIGTTEPDEKLHVAGNLHIERDFANISFFSEELSGTFPSQRSEIRTNIDPPLGLSTIFPEENHMSFHIARDDNGSMEEVLRLQGDGNIGIGDTDIAYALIEITDQQPKIRLTDTRSGTSSFWNGGTVLGRLGFYTLDNPTGTTTGSIDMVTDNGTTHPDGRMEFRTAINGTASTKMVINSAGRVGIGTTNPSTYLHVAGAGRTASGSANYFTYVFGNNTSTQDASSRTDIVAYFEGDMVAKTAVTSMNVTSWSDARAKEIIGRSDIQEGLELLKQIQITDYRWIDTLEDHGRIQKKIIAQEVEQILPNAVSRMRKVIPSVYQKAIQLEYNESKEELTLYLAKNHDFEIGDKVRVFTDTEELEEVEVLAIDSDKCFTISAKPANGAFVYGKWVDDYRNVDYDALSILNISATQEQQRLIENHTEEIKSQGQIIEQQQQGVDGLTNEHQYRQEEIDALKLRFEALETMILENGEQR